jgi:hypothetical protein
MIIRQLSKTITPSSFLAPIVSFTFFVVASHSPVTAQKKLVANQPKESITVLLRNPLQVDALTLKCKADNLKLLAYECEFSQIGIFVSDSSLPPEPAEIQKLRKEIVRDHKNVGLRAFRKQCVKGKNDLSKNLALHQENRRKALVIEREIAENEQMCACKTPDCVADVTIRQKTEEAARKKCQIWGRRFSMRLERVTQNRWVGTSGPSGLCEIITTVILVYDPQEDAWTYTQKKVNTQSGDKTGLQSCNDLEKPSVYYSHPRYVTQPALADCEYIDTIYPE